MNSVKQLAVRLVVVLVVLGGVIAGSTVTSPRAPAAAPARILSASEMAQTFGDGEANKCVVANQCQAGQVGEGNVCFRCKTDNESTYTTCCHTSADQKCLWGGGKGTAVCGEDIPYEETGNYAVTHQDCLFCEPTMDWGITQFNCDPWTGASGDPCAVGPSGMPAARKKPSRGGFVPVQTK